MKRAGLLSILIFLLTISCTAGQPLAVEGSRNALSLVLAVKKAGDSYLAVGFDDWDGGGPESDRAEDAGPTFGQLDDYGVLLSGNGNTAASTSDWKQAVVRLLLPGRNDGNRMLLGKASLGLFSFQHSNGPGEWLIFKFNIPLGRKEITAKGGDLHDFYLSAAIQDLSQKLDRDPDDIVIYSYRQLQETEPVYQILLEVDQKFYEYHGSNGEILFVPEGLPVEE